MFEGYKKIFNGHGLRSLIKAPVMPAPKLAIGDDDEKASIPLLIFTEQGTMPNKVNKMPKINDYAYEDLAEKGANDTLSNDKFVTDDFQLGSPISGF